MISSTVSSSRSVAFMADDLGWHNVGWHNPEMLTPNSDQLVAEGVELDRHYVYMCE